MSKIYILVLLFIASALSLDAQRISFLNPGFEGRPGHSLTPRHWIDCGPRNESPPDVLPEPTFQVTKLPYSGNTYLGMVTRDNDTWESVAANLTEPLAAGTCYKFSIALAQSLRYYSVSRARNEPANFIDPVILRIWGSNGNCRRVELLADSPVIDHEAWKVYTFLLKPQENSYSSIILEVSYPAGILTPTNGNLLLDGASAFETLPNCVLEGSTAPETAATSTVVNINTPLNTGANDELVVLKLPGADYFKDEESLRFFAANVLNDLYFDERNQLNIQQFQMEGESTVRKGHPAWFALQHALQFYPDQKWELVIYTDEKVNQELRVLELGRQLNPANDIALTVNAYDAREYDGVSWFCMSVANGLYLRRL